VGASAPSTAARRRVNERRHGPVLQTAQGKAAAELFFIISIFIIIIVVLGRAIAIVYE
jgi:hypothetical protein